MRRRLVKEDELQPPQPVKSKPSWGTLTSSAPLVVPPRGALSYVGAREEKF